jgi:hypothetical protein
LATLPGSGYLPDDDFDCRVRAENVTVTKVMLRDADQEMVDAQGVRGASVSRITRSGDG